MPSPSPEAFLRGRVLSSFPEAWLRPYRLDSKDQTWPPSVASGKGLIFPISSAFYPILSSPPPKQKNSSKKWSFSKFSFLKKHFPKLSKHQSLFFHLPALPAPCFPAAVYPAARLDVIGRAVSVFRPKPPPRLCGMAEALPPPAAVRCM